MFTKKKQEVKNTMSREEYEKTLKSLQDQIEELKKVEVVDDKQKKGEIWQPKHYEPYFFICGDNTVNHTINYKNSAIDDCFMESANFYKTRKEAERQANVQKYTNLFRKYVEEHSKPLDWTDIGTDKWFIKWSFYGTCGSIVFDCYSKVKAQGVIYASSKDILEDAIEFVGKYNVIKYVLGINND